MSSEGRGLLFIVSAPSGTGKTTLVEQLVERTPDLKMSRSYTSRPARHGETDGVDYNFVTRDRFEAMIAAGEFMEWADVFGNLYGTCTADTRRLLAEGSDVVLVIDVQGARGAGIAPLLLDPLNAYAVDCDRIDSLARLLDVLPERAASEP